MYHCLIITQLVTVLVYKTILLAYGVRCKMYGDRTKEVSNKNQHIYICRECEKVPNQTVNSMRRLLIKKECTVSGVLHSLAKTSLGVVDRMAFIHFTSNNDEFLSEEGKGLKIRCLLVTRHMLHIKAMYDNQSFLRTNSAPKDKEVITGDAFLSCFTEWYGQNPNL